MDTLLDIRGYSLSQFIAFLFDRPVSRFHEESNAKLRKEEEPWYWHVGTKFIGFDVVNHYVAFFSEPSPLLEGYSRMQLEQGFWAIQGPNLDCSVLELIENRQLPLLEKERQLRATYGLFEHVFVKDALFTSCYMFWDSLAYSYCCGNRKPEENYEDRMLQEAMFQTLLKILDLPSLDCKFAALHGLGHLRHPRTGDFVNVFLERNQHLGDEIKDYAVACIDGKVM
jgi:hypothetical protein